MIKGEQITAETKGIPYTLIFQDEFSSNALDTTKWGYVPRSQSTWSHWIGEHADLVQVKRGKLICRAIPLPKGRQDTVPMLTGAIWSKNRFEFQYGKIEVRMRSNAQAGNFASCWLGQKRPSGKKVAYGEIDIVEAVNAEGFARHAYHTAHTLAHREEKKNDFRTPLKVTQWHIYSIEWTPKSILWRVDGKLAATYQKPNIKEGSGEDVWPFDYPYYLILNQSVLHGAHGISACLNQTYETQFDWIRVYQRTSPSCLPTH